MPLNRKHAGGSFDEFLKEQGIHEEVMGLVEKKRLALQILREMNRRKITKAALARQIKTSRAQIDRILNPDNVSVTLDSLERVAQALGCHISLHLVKA